MGLKLTKWLVFSVLGGVLAFGAAAILLEMRNKPVELKTLLGNGQLLPVCASLAAKAMADAFMARINFGVVKAIVGGASFLAWGAVTIVMALLSNVDDGAPQAIAEMSLRIFFCTVVLGLLGVALDSAEVKVR